MINEGQEQITQLLNSQDREDCLLGIILAMKTQSWAWLRWNLHNHYFPVLVNERTFTIAHIADRYDDLYMYVRGDIICHITYGTLLIHKKGERTKDNIMELPADHIIELE
jgi:hypothetical protein